MAHMSDMQRDQIYEAAALPSSSQIAGEWEPSHMDGLKALELATRLQMLNEVIEKFTSHCRRLHLLCPEDFGPLLHGTDFEQAELLVLEMINEEDKQKEGTSI